MAKTKRRTTITAGRLVCAVCYEAVMPRDEEHVRAAKCKCSSAGRQRMNLKYSWQKLEQVLAANFDSGDLVLTLTYDKDHLPKDKKGAIKLLKKFIVQLRAERRKHEQKLKYIYVTESKHGEGRLHHHMVINGTGNDYELIKSLWIYGSNIEITQLDARDYGGLAKYLTKEPLETGSANGQRTWVPCKGLIHPKPKSDWVDSNMTLTAPPRAIIIFTDSHKNAYGSYTYIKYLLEKPYKPKYIRPKKKKRIEVSSSDLEHCISNEKG